MFVIFYFLHKNGKWQTAIDRHDPRLIPNFIFHYYLPLRTAIQDFKKYFQFPRFSYDHRLLHLSHKKYTARVYNTRLFRQHFHTGSTIHAVLNHSGDVWKIYAWLYTCILVPVVVSREYSDPYAGKTGITFFEDGNNIFGRRE